MQAGDTPHGITPRQAIAALVALLIVAYWPFAISELFWDDYLVIRPDGPIAHLSTLSQAFFGRCILFSDAYSYPYYRPLIDILFILEYAVAGVHPFLYHLTNFGLHAANAVMLLLFLFRILPDTKFRNLAAVFGVGVFALHPIQCESVLWPAARPAVLSLFFLLLGLHAFLKASTGGKLRFLFSGLTVLCFIAALLSKEIAIILVPVTLLLFGARDLTRPRIAIYTAIALMAVLGCYIFLNSAIGSSASHLGSTNVLELFAQGIRSLGIYAFRLIFPVNLHPSYTTSAAASWMELAVGGFVAASALVASFVALLHRSRNALLAAVGLLFFCGSACLPLLGGQFSIADRYLYQSMGGLGIACAIAFERLSRRKPCDARTTTIVIFGLLIGLTMLAMHQSTYWITAESMWSHVIESEPTNRNANMYLGEISERRGNLQEAEKFYLEPLKSGAQNSEAAGNNLMALARVRFASGNADGAIEAYREAAQISRFQNDATIRQAVVEFSRGNVDAARAIVAAFHANDSDSASVYTNLALLSLRMNHDDQAATAWYKRARERGALPIAEIEILLKN